MSEHSRILQSPDLRPHCGHWPSFTRLTLPPTYAMQCCWCGEIQHVRQQPRGTNPGHGPLVELPSFAMDGVCRGYKPESP